MQGKQRRWAKGDAAPGSCLVPGKFTIIHNPQQSFLCYYSHGNVEVCCNSHRNTHSATPLLWNGLKILNNTIPSFSITLGLVTCLGVVYPKSIRPDIWKTGDTQAKCMKFLLLLCQSPWTMWKSGPCTCRWSVSTSCTWGMLAAQCNTWLFFFLLMSCRLKISSLLHSRAQTASCILPIPCAVLGELIIIQDLLQKTVCVCNSINNPQNVFQGSPQQGQLLLAFWLPFKPVLSARKTIWTWRLKSVAPGHQVRFHFNNKRIWCLLAGR